MKTFNINARARKLGAIGIFYPIMLEQQAVSKEQLIKELYDVWDFERSPQIKELRSPINEN